jgi:AAA lid domain
LSRTVTLPPDTQTIIQAIWLEHKTLFKEDDREQLSDRRLKKVLGLLQVSAASSARSEIDLSGMFLLKHCLWNHPDNIQAVSKLILKHLNLATGKKDMPSVETKTTLLKFLLVFCQKLCRVWLPVFSLKKAIRLIIITQYLKYPIRLFRQSNKIPQH